MSTVLVAEDDLAARDLLAFLLASCGYRVIACAGGGSALATARRERPDAAIVDVSAPGAGGSGLCRALRRAAGAGWMPVLLLTCPGGDAEAAGADEYLIKPFDPSELLARVETLLERAGPDRRD